MARIDYDMLANVMAEDRDLLRTYYYHCLPHQSATPEQEEKDKFSRAQRFHRRLNHLDSFAVRLGRLAYRGIDDEGRPVFEQKRVDVMLATDLVMHSTKRLITHASLLTGDSDFLPAIKIAQSEGVHLSLFYCKDIPPHDELLDIVDARRKIDEEMIESIKRS